MKRKRLEGFLAERPPPESVEQVLWGPAFNVGVPPQGGLPAGSRSAPGSRSPKNSVSPRSPRRSPMEPHVEPFAGL
eukprot:scaffold23821_cov60-Phaeocystis_antarctica.AAC.5